MAVGPLYDMAEQVIGLIKPGDEPATLFGHFDKHIPQIWEICRGRFPHWQGTLNVIQNWYMTGHEIFDGIRDVIVLGDPMGIPLADCMEPDRWPKQRPDSLPEPNEPDLSLCKC